MIDKFISKLTACSFPFSSDKPQVAFLQAGSKHYHFLNQKTTNVKDRLWFFQTHLKNRQSGQRMHEYKHDLRRKIRRLGSIS